MKAIKIMFVIDEKNIRGLRTFLIYENTVREITNKMSELLHLSDSQIDELKVVIFRDRPNEIKE